MMILILGARAFVVTVCWWRGNSLCDIGAPLRHAISHRSLLRSLASSLGMTSEAGLAFRTLTFRRAVL